MEGRVASTKVVVVAAAQVLPHRSLLTWRETASEFCLTQLTQTTWCWPRECVGRGRVLVSCQGSFRQWCTVGRSCCIALTHRLYVCHSCPAMSRPDTGASRPLVHKSLQSASISAGNFRIFSYLMYTALLSDSPAVREPLLSTLYFSHKPSLLEARRRPPLLTNTRNTIFNLRNTR